MHKPETKSASGSGSQPSPRKKTIRVVIAPLTMVYAVLLAGIVWMLGRLVPVILVLIAALMIVGSVSPVVQWLVSKKCSRVGGIIVVFAGLLLMFVALITLTVPTLIEQISEIVKNEASMRERVASLLASFSFTKPLVASLRSMQYSALLKSSGADVLTVSKNTLALLVYVASAFSLSLYIVLDSDRLRGAAFAMVPRSHHMRLSRILLNLQTIVGGYVRGQLVTCLCMGAFLFTLLKACGVPNALALAVFGAIADILPFIGITLTMIPAVLIAFMTSELAAVITFGGLLLYAQVENRILVPTIYGRALRLPPSVVLFSLLVGGALYGIIGALLALPVAAALLMLLDEMRLDMPGEERSAESKEQKVQDANSDAEYERRTEGMSAEDAAGIAVEISDTRTKDELEHVIRDPVQDA
jgi:predicted PurR-regulated permease PerM